MIFLVPSLRGRAYALQQTLGHPQLRSRACPLGVPGSDAQVTEKLRQFGVPSKLSRVLQHAWAFSTSSFRHPVNLGPSSIWGYLCRSQALNSNARWQSSRRANSRANTLGISFWVSCCSTSLLSGPALPLWDGTDISQSVPESLCCVGITSPCCRSPSRPRSQYESWKVGTLSASRGSLWTCPVKNVVVGIAESGRGPSPTYSRTPQSTNEYIGAYGGR